jgi:hypothetical protein
MICNLVLALESLALSAAIQMQKTYLLPLFLLSNLPKGFLSTLESLNNPTYKNNRQQSLTIQYYYVGGPRRSRSLSTTDKTIISEWLCPLCELHGTFRQIGMLACHLQWDHTEVYCGWDKMEDTEVSLLNLGLHPLVIF